MKLRLDPATIFFAIALLFLISRANKENKKEKEIPVLTVTGDEPIYNKEHVRVLYVP